MASILTADSPLGVVLIILALVGGATIGIGLMAAAFSFLIGSVFSSFGDRDERLVAGITDADADGDA